MDLTVLLDRMKKKIRNVCLDLKLNGSIEFEMIYDRNANNIYIYIGDKSENLRNDKSFVIDFRSELLYVAWADREDRYYGQQRKVCC